MRELCHEPKSVCQSMSATFGVMSLTATSSNTSRRWCSFATGLGIAGTVRRQVRRWIHSAFHRGCRGSHRLSCVELGAAGSGTDCPDARTDPRVADVPRAAAQVDGSSSSLVPRSDGAGLWERDLAGRSVASLVDLFGWKWRSLQRVPRGTRLKGCIVPADGTTKESLSLDDLHSRPVV